MSDTDDIIVVQNKNLDATKLTRADGTVVDRERVVVGGESIASGSLARVENEMLYVGGGELLTLLEEIKLEIRQLRYALLNQLH